MGLGLVFNLTIQQRLPQGFTLFERQRIGFQIQIAQIFQLL